MENDLTREKAVGEIVRSVVNKHGTSSKELFAILLEINQTLGYLPTKALKELGIRLKVPESTLLSVVSFYNMLSTKPRGRHVIQFCESAPCHVVGGARVLKSLQNALKLDAGETSADGKWTLNKVSCMGQCDKGPSIMIDDDIYGNVQPDEVGKILARYE